MHNLNIVNDMEDIYRTSSGESFQHNWYTQKPYAIVFTNRHGITNTFYLPISPSNLNITTHFATNVLATMYGTVEEHSEQRYYDIQISGTTGMSPRYYEPMSQSQLTPNSSRSTGRGRYVVKEYIAGGFFKRTQDLINGAANQVSDLFGSNKPTTGIDLNKTGYIAFHNLYKFLLIYKKDASGVSSRTRRSKHPLQFVNYKDNNQYDIAIQTFQLTRDVSNPMLYNYNIIIRAYNLREANSDDIESDIEERLDSLGLAGFTASAFSKMANKVRQAKNAAYLAIAAAKGFGK